MGAVFTCCQKPSTTDADHPVQHEVVNVRNGEVHVEHIDANRGTEKTDYTRTPVADPQVELEFPKETDKRHREEVEVDDEMVAAVTETRSYAAPPAPSETKPKVEEEEGRKQRTRIVRETPDEGSGESSGTGARSTTRTFGGGGGYRTTTTVETTETRVTRSSIPTLKASASPPSGASDQSRPRPKVTIVREFDQS